MEPITLTALHRARKITRARKRKTTVTILVTMFTRSLDKSVHIVYYFTNTACILRLKQAIQKHQYKVCTCRDNFKIYFCIFHLIDVVHMFVHACPYLILHRLTSCMYHVLCRPVPLNPSSREDGTVDKNNYITSGCH